MSLTILAIAADVGRPVATKTSLIFFEKLGTLLGGNRLRVAIKARCLCDREEGSFLATICI